MADSSIAGGKLRVLALDLDSFGPDGDPLELDGGHSELDLQSLGSPRNHPDPVHQLGVEAQGLDPHLKGPSRNSPNPGDAFQVRIPPLKHLLLEDHLHAGVRHRTGRAMDLNEEESGLSGEGERPQAKEPSKDAEGSGRMAPGGVVLHS